MRVIGIFVCISDITTVLKAPENIYTNAHESAYN